MFKRDELLPNNKNTCKITFVIDTTKDIDIMMASISFLDIIETIKSILIEVYFSFLYLTIIITY